MLNAAQFDAESRRSLGARIQRGQRLIGDAWGMQFVDMHEDDREAAVRDAISDMLTALLGPAGHSVKGEDEGGGFYRAEIVIDEQRLNEAGRIVALAVDSYEGDAEDYWKEDGGA